MGRLNYFYLIISGKYWITSGLKWSLNLTLLQYPTSSDLFYLIHVEESKTIEVETLIYTVH